MKNQFLVIFDCDGTLVDSQGLIISAMRHAFRALELPIPTDRSIRQAVGLSLYDSMEALLPNGSARDHAELVSKFQNSFSGLRAERKFDEPLYPGVEKVLDSLESRNMLLGIATGKSMRGLKYTLNHHGIFERFVTLQTADNNPGKPHPKMIENALADAAVKYENAIMVGDTTFDIEMALAAGVTPVGVSWGYHAALDLQKAGASVVINDFEDLLEILNTAVQ